MSVHRFELLFRIEPAGDFGLPIQDTVVVKAGEGMAIYSALIDRTTGNRVSHGMLPVYRDGGEALHVERESDGLQIRVRDNFLAVQLDGRDYVSVQKNVLHAVDRFMQLLSLTRNTYFRAELVQAVLLNGNKRSAVRMPRTIPLMKGQIYDLDSFKKSLSWSLDSIPLTRNRRLAKALDYLYHGLFLSNIRNGLGLENSTAQSYLAADIFSNFYKAASTIVGDPSKDSDFQFRYKKIGLSTEFWKEKRAHPQAKKHLWRCPLRPRRQAAARGSRNGRSGDKNRHRSLHRAVATERSRNRHPLNWMKHNDGRSSDRGIAIGEVRLPAA